MKEVTAAIRDTKGSLLFKYTFPTWHLFCGDIVVDRDGGEWVVMRRKWDRLGDFNLIVKRYEDYLLPSMAKE